MISPTYSVCQDNDDDIFERCSWFYTLCRELLFTDHTDEIVARLAPLLKEPSRPVLLEVGCGPGFYSSRIAKRFPQIDVVGIDPSENLLTHARQRASRNGLTNCRYIRARVEELGGSPESTDFIIASRLLLILGDRGPALKAMHTALKTKGVLFIAEPRSSLRAALPFACMRIIQFLTCSWTRRQAPMRCAVLDTTEFADYVASQPWSCVRLWSDTRYQYALCEKP